jgi:hypothetical protein
MSRLYTMEFGGFAGKNRKRPEEQLSQRAAILAIAGLSLLLWAPILLPLFGMLHR